MKTTCRNNHNSKDMKALVIITGILLKINSVSAQNSSKTEITDTTSVDTTESYYWFNTGIGLSSVGFSGIAGLSMQDGNFLMSCRVAANSELLAGNLWDAGMLFGITNGPRRIHYSIATGFGVVSGVKKEFCIFCSEDPTTSLPINVGLPIETQLTFRPNKQFGYGLYGFADINKGYSFAGLAFAIQFGGLR